MSARAPFSEVVAGYLAVFAMFIAGLGIAYRPVRLAPVAMLVALVAVVLASERNDGLTRIAMFVAIAGFVLGMSVAVVAETPLW